MRIHPVISGISMMLPLFWLSGCEFGPASPAGFALPPGDANAGQATFVELRCHDCHSARDVPQRDPAATDIHLPLGGKSTRVTTYASLLTSIINPSHRYSARLPRVVAVEEGESRMPVYNELMTVQELIDLVAYLQPQYEVIVVSPNSYESYYP